MLAVCLVPGVPAAKQEPRGVVAASVGDRVVLVDPAAAAVRSFEAGPVAWLFPAPGGLLFAPDLVHGTTTVIDLRAGRVAQRMDKVTMPRFGALADRYVVVAGDVLVVGWPDRALLARIEAGIRYPWQSFVSRDAAVVVVFERRHDGGVPPALWLVDLVEHRVVQRVPLDPHALRVAMVTSLGLIAVAEGEKGVALLDAGTLLPVARLTPPGRAVDVAWSGVEKRLLVASGRDGTGSVLGFELGTKKGKLRSKETRPVALGSPVTHLALSPDETWAAAAAESGELVVFRVDRGEARPLPALDGDPRDLVWCDPERPGPLLSQWSVSPGGEITARPTPAFGGRRPPGTP